jgi:dolichyl-phosphate-mannose-protein mannosyltransferase
VRLAATALVGFNSVQFGDARAYLFAARTIAHEHQYPPTTDGRLFFRPPGYPFFLVLATLGAPDRIALAKAANALLGGVAALLLVGISAKIFRRRGVALATGVAAALHPGFVLIATDVQSEPLFMALFLASGFLLLSAVDRPSSNLAVAAGVLLALAALTRTTALALAILLFAPLLDGRYPIRVRSHVCASALLGFLLALAPWTLRNALVFRELIVVNDAGGTAFYQGNSDWTMRFYELRDRAEYENWITAMARDMDQKSAELVRAGTSPVERSRAFRDMAIRERRADPAGWAKLFLQKTWDWLRPYPSRLFWPTWVVIGTGAYYTVLFLLAAIGFVRAPRPGVRAFSLALLALTMAAHVVIIVVWRYRIPYWDPVLLLYGVFGAAAIARVKPARVSR